MDSNENLCRICLTTDVFFDWTEAIFEFSGPSYKKCYYQYTHLQDQDADLYTQMLCLDCGNGLRNAYLLVEKASASDLKLRSHKPELNAANYLPFKKEQVISVDMSDSYNSEIASASDINLRSHKPELNAAKSLQFKKEQVISVDISDSYNSEIALASDLELKNQKSNIKSSNLLELKKEHIKVVDMEDSFNTTIGSKNEQFNILTEATVSTVDNELLDVDSSIIQNSDSDSDFEFEVNESHIKPKKKRKKLTLLCSFCSRIFDSKSHLDNHERTHEQNRERTEACTVCGVKFYCKNTLKAHMIIHDDSRERKHKCEFCPKAFFARGALNVHKRIHLGQMIKCNFCPKEFYRQIDLDRHIKSHNVAPLTSDTGIATKTQNAKYYRECNICGDKVNTNYWKHHKAKHLNQHSIQCLICSKKFFPRSDVRRHLKQCHDIVGADYRKFLKQLDIKFEPRVTRLMIEQEVLNVYTEK